MIEQTFEELAQNILTFLIWMMILIVVYYVIPSFFKMYYFRSQEFLEQKKQNANAVAEYNRVKQYVNEMIEQNQFNFNAIRGYAAQPADYINLSRYNYNRNKNVATHDNHTVHVSLEIVRKVANNPIEYLCKYFNIMANENNLNRIEEVGENVSRLANAIENLNERIEDITNIIDPPYLIQKYFMDEFLEQVGIYFPEISVPYERYCFEYVSAGGNSSQRTVIDLDSNRIDELAEYIDYKMNLKKSVIVQRSLMTSRLRERIKARDLYTCQYCGVSIDNEPHLLLEIDHILPISKGGMTEESNLQTLCWKCNRKKSNKIA